MITVRAAAHNDVPGILKIAGESISPAWTHGYVKERLGRDDTLLLVALEEQRGRAESRIVGFAAFRQVGDDGELLQIAVEIGERRCGIGSLLLGAITDYASKKALDSILLEVRSGNGAAIALYKKHGFEYVRIRKNYYSAPVEDAIVMAKSIDK